MTKAKNELERREDKYHKKMAAAIAKKGVVLLDLDDQIADPRAEGVYYTELRFKLPQGEAEDVLAMLKREGAEGKEIAFHYSPTVGQALEGLVSRLKNGSLKWREDKPYGET